MKISRRIILFSLVLLLLLSFAIWNRALFITCFIEPMARIFWLLYRTLLSVDQVIYWALLILSALPLTLRMFTDHTETLFLSAYQYSIQENDRVAYWETLLKSAIKSERDRLVLQRNLETLQRSISAQSKENDKEGFLIASLKIGFQERIQIMWKSLPLSNIGQRQGVHKPTELEKCVDGILQSMETQLELHHD